MYTRIDPLPPFPLVFTDIDPLNVAEVPKDQMPEPPPGMAIDVGMVLQLSTGRTLHVSRVKEACHI